MQTLASISTRRMVRMTQRGILDWRPTELFNLPPRIVSKHNAARKARFLARHPHRKPQ